MREREAFLMALEQDEDDEVTRLVFADWLDDNGEHEEADRMRKWKAAKAWLVRFYQDNSWSAYEGDVIASYEDLLRVGSEAVADANADGFIGIDCGRDENLCEALRENTSEFWKHFAIVTGLRLPADVETNSGFGCSC